MRPTLCLLLLTACGSESSSSSKPSGSGGTATPPPPAKAPTITRGGKPVSVQSAVAISYGGSAVDLVFASYPNSCKDAAMGMEPMDEQRTSLRLTLAPLLAKDGSQEWAIASTYFRGGNHNQRGAAVTRGLLDFTNALRERHHRLLPLHVGSVAASEPFRDRAAIAKDGQRHCAVPLGDQQLADGEVPGADVELGLDVTLIDVGQAIRDGESGLIAGARAGAIAAGEQQLPHSAM